MSSGESKPDCCRLTSRLDSAYRLNRYLLKWLVLMYSWLRTMMEKLRQASLLAALMVQSLTRPTSLFYSNTTGTLILAKWSPFAVISSFTAHRGAVCAVACNRHGMVLWDCCGISGIVGTSLITVGIDGCVKLWSNKGALRSTLLRVESSVQGVSWAYDNFHIALCSQHEVFVIDLRQQRTSKHWTAHLGFYLL